MREKESTNVFMKVMIRYCAKGCKKFTKTPLSSHLSETHLCTDRYCGELLYPPPKKKIGPTYKLNYIKINEN